MFYHDQDQAVDRPRNLSIVALILMDTTLVPDVPKPLEEDMQDAKLLYYYSPEQASVHTIRYQVGLSEGLLLFFGEYADKIPTNVETELDDHRFAVETIEENLLMCVLIEEHGDKTDAIRDEGLALIQVLHKHWKLFYGTFNSWRNANDKRLNENFKSVMDHFVAQFIRFSSIDEQESLINIQRLQPSGLERFGLQRAQFLLTSQIESILEVFSG
jgi:First Longin domain of INTU, CCZ1 and HPS4